MDGMGEITSDTTAVHVGPVCCYKIYMLVLATKMTIDEHYKLSKVHRVSV